TVRTLVTIQVLNKDLAFQDIGGGQQADFHINGALYRIDNRRMPGFDQDVTLQMTSREYKELLDQPSLFQKTVYLEPGKYKLHLTIQDKHSPNIGIQDPLFEVPRIPEQVLQTSSMILAYSVTDLPKSMVGNEPFALGDKKVKPNVSGVFRRDQSLNIWQEIYGLTVEQASHKPSATIEMLITQNKQEVKKTVSTSEELAGSGQQMKYTNSVPLTDFAPGQYEVQVKVTDNLTNESIVTPKKFTVAAVPVK
ncbi:MAG TPA: hypothetical protein VK210_18735, partial [Terriglobia bacterium]|nr:hypothetical protein [Terriglobia bacterium]